MSRLADTLAAVLLAVVWRPTAWDVPLTRPPGVWPYTRWRTWSEMARRWVTR